MSDANSSMAPCSGFEIDSARLELAIRAIVIGTAVGVVGGVGTFMFGNPDVTPFPTHPLLPLVPIVAAGFYAHLLARSLRESFGAAAVGFLVGSAVSIALWVSPVLLLSYTGLAAELMAAPRLRDGVVDVMTVYLVIFAGSYLATVIGGGVTE